MDHKQITTDQVVHLLYSLYFFLVLSAAAVGLDLVSQWVRTLGVSAFTYTAIALTAHAMLVLDVLLFLIALLVSGWEFVKGLRL